MANGPKGSRVFLEQPFLLNPKEASLWAEIPRFPASEDCSRQKTVLAPSTSRLQTWREKSSSLPLAQTLPSLLTVWDQSDVLGVGAQEVLHGASQEQGLIHPVQLQGAVHTVHLQLCVVRGVGLQTDFCGLVPQQPSGLSLGAAPGPGEDKGT